jgi:DNA-directed RNA polymerase subunit omega
MAKRKLVDSTDIIHRVEHLIAASSNRYRITVMVAQRAKQHRYANDENHDDPNTMKPILRAIIEMSDEVALPGIISEV